MSSELTGERAGGAGIIVLLVCLVTLVVLVVAASFFSGFDFTDEGLLLYVLTHGDDATHISPFYLLFSEIGATFDHLLIGYRFLNLMLLICASILLGWSYVACFARGASGAGLVGVVALVMLASLANYAFGPTLTYNTVSAIAAYLWASGALMTFSVHQRGMAVHGIGRLPVALLTTAIFLALVARPPFGVVLLVFTGIFFFALNARSKVPWNSGATSVMGLSVGLSLGFCLLHTEAIAAIAGMYRLHASSSHTGVIFQYCRQALVFVLVAMVAYALLHLARRVLVWASHLQVAMFFLLGLVMVAISADRLVELLALQRDKVVYAMVVVFTDLAAETIRRTWSRLPGRGLRLHETFWNEEVALLWICFLPAFLSGLSTNGNLFRYAGFSMGLLALPSIGCLYRTTNGFRSHNTRSLLFGGSLFSIVLLLSVLGQYYAPKRNSSYLQQTYLSQSPYLAHVRVEPDIGKGIDALREALTEFGFDFHRDRLLAYPDLPGFIAASGAQAFGYPWVYTGYAEIDELNCGFVEMTRTRDVENVFLLLGSDMGEALSECVFDRIERLPETRARALGGGYHYRDEMEYRLRISGPYALRSHAEHRQTGPK
jgi:hypothetical protein